MPAASSCAVWLRTSTRPPSGGRPASRGSRWRSPTRGWWRWACPRSRCRASRKRSGWGWQRAPTSSSTTATTTRALGAGVRERAHPHRCQRLQRLRGDVASHDGAGARSTTSGHRGLTVLTTQDFGAQPGDLNPLGYRDSIGQPAIEGSGVEPLPGQGPAIKAGEFILGYPGEAGVPLPAPQPGRAGTKRHLRRAAQVPDASGDVQPLPAGARPDAMTSGSCSRRSWSGAGAAAHR